MKTSQKEPVTFLAACAIEKDYVYISGKPDVVDAEEQFSRLFFLDEQRPASPWVRHDLPGEDVVSIAVGVAMFGQPRVYSAMSKNGVIEHSWPGGSLVELIDGAGVARTAMPVYGYVNEIRSLGSNLFVCGGGGQIYRRERDAWEHIAPGFQTPARAPLGGAIHEKGSDLAHHFTSIDGPHGNDIYVVGHDGEVQHFDGHEWQQCDSSTDEILLRVRCADDDLVWACGFNGTLLRGNASQGFKNVSAYDMNVIFHDLCLYAGMPYLASNDGLFRFDGHRIESVPLQFADGDNAVCALDARDGVLWCFGYRAIATFDGGQWRHITHPDNV
jgi:hypothetical protein